MRCHSRLRILCAFCLAIMTMLAAVGCGNQAQGSLSEKDYSAHFGHYGDPPPAGLSNWAKTHPPTAPSKK